MFVTKVHRCARLILTTPTRFDLRDAMRRTSWLLVARAWVPAKGTADTVAFPAQAASALDAIHGGTDAGQASAAWILER